MLQKAQREQFYGQLQIDFRAGEITLVRRTETIKIENTDGMERFRQHEQRNRPR
jgi:hypothetical protein